jgi:hypothetical protein
MPGSHVLVRLSLRIDLLLHRPFSMFLQKATQRVGVNGCIKVY